MKHIKLYEEYENSLNEGAIPVFAPGDLYNPKFNMQWTGFTRWVETWKEEKQAFALVADFDYDKAIMNPMYRSKAQGTWDNKDLPLFTEKNKRYREVDFDFLEVIENTEDAHYPWIKIVDKKGVEFMIHPHEILDIQLGVSVRDRIFPGDKYLIDKLAGKVLNIRNDNVFVMLQDGTHKRYSLEKWKQEDFTKIDESKNSSETTGEVTTH